MRKLKKGYNDLQTISPDIAAEWHPLRNGTLTPMDVHNGSSQKVWWLCSKGHSYVNAVGKRTVRGTGCPFCRKENRSFAKMHPELLVFWDYDKNMIKPEDVFYGSEKRVWWICPSGHSYEQRISNKSNGNGCPICAHQRVNMETCLAVVNPNIAAEWHPTKNGRLTPYDVMPYSHKKVWWKCINGHEYQSAVYSKHKSGCPVCNLEKRTSFPEQAISYYLGCLFPVQNRCKISGFEADIFCPTYNLAIEYDGEYFHNGSDSLIRDEQKNSCFFNQNIFLIRIKDSKEKMDFDCQITKYGCDFFTTYSQEYDYLITVISKIIQLINDKYQENYSLNIDIKNDKSKIISTYAQQKDINSFLKQKPLGALKWHFEKNGSIDLRLLPKTSKKKFWWKCPTCHNEWYGPLDNIVNSVTCNKCSRQVKANYDVADEVMMESSIAFRELPVNLYTQNPMLASQWHPTRNGFFKPTHVTHMSGKRVWWLCPECGNEWTQTIKTRNNGKSARKCPVCANNQKKENTDSLNKFHKILFKEWHSTKNGDKKLTDYTPGSNIKAWWKCSMCGYEFNCIIKTRKHGRGCPVCARRNTNASKCKKVKNLDTNEVFESVTKAALSCGVTPKSISNCLTGKMKTAGGFRWGYFFG